MVRQAFIRQAFFARVLLLAFFVGGAVSFAAAQTLVPPGNRSVEQPGVPGGSTKRTKAGGTTFDAKYHKVYALLENDKALRSKIREAASAYGIDPMHIVGAIVGEHTYNVDAYDRLQTYYVKALPYLKSDLSFAYEGEDVADFVQRSQFSECAASDSYSLWTCRERVWDHSFRGKTSAGQHFPTTASAPCSSSLIMPARPSGSAS